MDFSGIGLSEGWLAVFFFALCLVVFGEAGARGRILILSISSSGRIGSGLGWDGMGWVNARLLLGFSVANARGFATPFALAFASPPALPLATRFNLMTSISSFVLLFPN